MSFYLPFLIGFILLIAISIYSIFWFTNKKTNSVRRKLLNGEKTYLVHWIYPDAIDFASFQGRDSALSWYKNKLKNISEVFICPDGVLIGDVIFYSWNRFAYFKKLEITSGEPACIFFKIEFLAGETNTVAEFFVPIPDGKEREAEDVLDALYGIDRFNY
jgi:hypothetical protein